MTKKTKKITIIIPCFNEEKGISSVISALPKRMLKSMGYTCEVLVVDNNSSDRTAEKARRAGAKVIVEKKQGKGFALIAGFKNVSEDTDIVVMMYGDDTYSLKEILRLIEPIDSKFCDVVVGSRLGGRIEKGAMTEFNRFGNWIFTFLVRTAYHGNVTDVCSGFFAWDKRVIDTLVPHIKSNGFSIEMEMIAKMAKMGFNIISVPISYSAREGESSLKPISDGFSIMKTWLVHLNWTQHKKMSLVRRIPVVKHVFNAIAPVDN